MHARTRRQREVLDFITRYIESHGYRPSYQVIARHMGVSSRAGIGRIVRDLEQQGFLERQRIDGHFAIALTDQNGRPSEGTTIDWMGEPVTTDGDSSSIPAPFSMPDSLLGGHDPADIRVFRVPDDSMSPNAVCRGDIALIEPRTFARDGDIVVAQVSNAMVLRKYFRSGAEIELCGAGPDGEVLRLSAEDVEIVGVLRGLVRPIS